MLLVLDQKNIIFAEIRKSCVFGGQAFGFSAFRPAWTSRCLKSKILRFSATKFNPSDFKLVRNLKIRLGTEEA